MNEDTNDMSEDMVMIARKIGKKVENVERDYEEDILIEIAVFQIVNYFYFSIRTRIIFKVELWMNSLRLC